MPFPEITVPYTLNGDRLYLLLADEPAAAAAGARRRARQVYALDKDQPVTEVRPLDRVDRRVVVRAAKVQPRAVRDLRRPRPAARDHRRLRRDLLRGVASDAGVRRARRARRAEVRHSEDGARHAACGSWRSASCSAASRRVAAGRLLATQIWGVSPYDPLSFGVVIVLLLVVGFQACLWPARRAAKVDPMVSLRQAAGRKVGG